MTLVFVVRNWAKVSSSKIGGASKEALKLSMSLRWTESIGSITYSHNPEVVNTSRDSSYVWNTMPKEVDMSKDAIKWEENLNP
jgi:hypothetical protein